MNFSQKTYSKLSHNLANKYSKECASALGQLKKIPNSHSSKWLRSHAKELKNYSPEKWYLLEQMKRLIFFYNFNKKLKAVGHEFSSDEDLVFEEWNRSEFADTFLRTLNKGANVKKASELTLHQLDEHLCVLSDRIIFKSNHSNKWYRPQSSLGDLKKLNKVTRLLESTIVIENFDFKLMTYSLKEMKDFSTRIEVALKIIKEFSPTSWERFASFTQVILPLKDEKLVSYSHQELPGYSIINLYHRDFVDLMDDLIHENGHHHLNYYLNLKKLLDEPLDSIYYSPWRRTLRPLRGIFHAYFTFFWAFKLFSDLSNSHDINTDWYSFEPDEKEKIYWRAIEEFLMLDYVFVDLQWARKNGLITDAGWELILDQRNELKKMSSKVKTWEKHLKKFKKELKDLKIVLKNSRKKYFLKSL